MQDRIEPETEEEQMGVEEVVEDIIESGIEDYISVHDGNGTRYVDADLIAVDYSMSNNKARQAKKLVEREVRAAQ